MHIKRNRSIKKTPTVVCCLPQIMRSKINNESPIDLYGSLQIHEWPAPQTDISYLTYTIPTRYREELPTKSKGLFSVRFVRVFFCFVFLLIVTQNVQPSPAFFFYLAVYSGPPLIRPPLGNGNAGLIRGVASREGYIRYDYTRFVL